VIAPSISDWMNGDMHSSGIDINALEDSLMMPMYKMIDR
jgi:hypothetical protein